MKLQSPLAALLLQSSLAVAATVDEWRSRSIYFALTDRVSTGSDSASACSDLGSYCGGTFSGLQDKLDYIQGMGFDAIWITPVVENKEGGYHGYWAQDLYAINTNYGTADDLKSLVSAGHEKGMYVMIDVVANHMGSGTMENNGPEPLNQDSAYHPGCEIDYDNQTSVEYCSIAGLPDVKTEDEAIRTVFQEWISWLVSEYSFDGARLDTVKHVEPDFWAGFSAAAGVYTIGEIWDGDPAYLAEWQSGMDGLLNYAIYYPLKAFYQQTGSSQDLVDMHNTVGSTFDDPAALGTFLDNHDNPRWLSENEDYTLLINALCYVMLGRGVPIVYYGTEQGYAGGADPANREDLWRSGFATGDSSVLYGALSRMGAARAGLGEAAGVDDHEHLYVADTAYAWSRAGGDLIVFTSNGGSGSSGDHCFGTGRPDGSWTDSYNANGTTLTADADGQLCLSVADGQPFLLVAN